jgi:alcohol dehydrogenase class IV
VTGTGAPPARTGPRFGRALAAGPRVCFGAGTVLRLPELLASRRARNVLLVCGEAAYEACGIRRLVGERLGGLRVERLGGFSANPKLADVERGVELARRERTDTVLAIGGGTAMDLGKSIAVLADEQGDAASLVERSRPLTGRRRRGLVLVPTTAGTGSEVTRFAVVYVDGMKRSLDHPCLAADDAVVDPELTFSMSPRLTAVTGMDALSQGIESYWCIRSTAESRRRASRAVRLALANLEAACSRPTPRVRREMSLAALLAGQAIDVTRTTAAHAVSYPLTGCYGIPHGHACALTLPRFFVFNAGVSAADVQDPRGAGFVRARMAELASLVGAATPQAACARLEALLGRLGLETRLSELGLNGEDRERVIALGFNPDRVGNNPRRLTPQHLRGILDSVR